MSVHEYLITMAEILRLSNERKISLETLHREIARASDELLRMIPETNLWWVA